MGSTVSLFLARPPSLSPLLGLWPPLRGSVFGGSVSGLSLRGSVFGLSRHGSLFSLLLRDSVSGLSLLGLVFGLSHHGSVSVLSRVACYWGPKNGERRLSLRGSVSDLLLRGSVSGSSLVFGNWKLGRVSLPSFSLESFG
jgi:hypothetical protein